MATMVERKMQSTQKEIEKLTKSLARYQGILEKKVAKCESLGCNWTRDEFFQHRDTDMTQEQDEAYFDKGIAEMNVEDTQRRLQKAQNRLSKLMPQEESVEQDRKEHERLSGIEKKWLSMTAEEIKADYERWLKQFKADCLKDGIIIEDASNNFICGQTAKGERFYMAINNGFTERSFHCYTLRVDGQTVFTSGDFVTAYRYIKKEEA